MNKYTTYAALRELKTAYATRMKRLSLRIFGDVTRPTDYHSMRVVERFSAKPIQKREEIVKYYPRLRETHKLMKHLRDYGLYRDEHQDFKEEIRRLKELRGKKIWKWGQWKEKKQADVKSLT